MLSNNPIYRSEICNNNDEATTVNENETDTNYENITIVNGGMKIYPEIAGQIQLH